MSDAAIEALGQAVLQNDAGRVLTALEEHPELRGRLDEEIPGGDFGATALMTAIENKNLELIDVLLAAGADINARSHWWAGGFGVLDGDHGLHDLLIERGAIVDAHAAAKLGKIDRLEELLTAAPELVHARGGDGQTPLHFASNVDVARFLLEHGADIDARDVDHEATAAQWMVGDRQDVARFLVEQGCHADLLMAAALGNIDLVRKHLDADPDSIRMAVTDEWFPKKDPRSGGIIYMWSLDRNKNAHWVARKFGHDAILQLLMERSPEDLKLAVAFELGDGALVESLLSAQPDLAKTLSREAQRRLVDAAQDNNTSAVRLMLQAGWPTDAHGQHNATALHWAAFHGNSEMIREILRYHPPMEDRKNEYKSTPLEWAIYGSVHSWNCKTGDYGGAVEALLEAGAQVPKPREDFAGSDAVRAVLDRQKKQ